MHTYEKPVLEAREGTMKKISRNNVSIVPVPSDRLEKCYLLALVVYSRRSFFQKLKKKKNQPGLSIILNPSFKKDM